MPRWVWTCLAFAAVLLLYDTVFSWLATCDQISGYPAADEAYKENCSAFQGPFVSVFRFALVAFGRSLHDYRDEVIAAFTVVLAVSTILLWRATERQLSHLSETAQKQLRAYVFIDVIELECIGREIKIEIAYRNRGQTPAYNLIQKAYTTVHTHPLGEDFDWPIIEALGTKGSVPPLGGEITSRLCAELPVELADAIGKDKLYLFAVAVYTDIFRNTHRTTIGGYFEAPGLGAADGSVPAFCLLDQYCESD